MPGATITPPTSAIGSLPGKHLALADGALLAQLGAAARLARLFVVLALAQLLGESAPLQQFLKAAQGRANRFPVVDAHPQRHALSCRRRGATNNGDHSSLITYFTLVTPAAAAAAPAAAVAAAAARAAPPAFGPRLCLVDCQRA